MLGNDAAEVVTYNALAKARCLFKEGYAVIGADTVVCFDGKGYGKPKDKSEAVAFLTCLSGKTHKVYTGVAVVCAKGEFVKVVETLVKFRNLSKAEISHYVNSGSPLDKAGAYGIQDFGGVFVEKIDGDYFNVVGLPISTLYEMLLECNVIEYQEGVF
jgi:septum formation protein